MSDEPPIARRTDPLGSHEGAEQIEPDRETLMRVVFQRCYGPEWVSGEEVLGIAASAGRRGREWRDQGYCWDTRPPANGKGPWSVRIGPPSDEADRAVMFRLYKQHAGEPEAEKIRERVHKLRLRDGQCRLSRWTVLEAIEDLRRL